MNEHRPRQPTTTKEPANDEGELGDDLQVDALCSEFESMLRDGRMPQVDDFLQRVKVELRPALAEELNAIEAERRDNTPLEKMPRSDWSTISQANAAADSAPSASNLRDVPEKIGRFEIRRFLGAGAFGNVYLAHDSHLKRDVALKLAKPETLSSPDRVERFLREARAAAGLQHPHIVAVFDAGMDRGYYYIASAFVRGQTMEAELKAGRPHPQRAARWIRQLAEALGYAHSRGVVHRDVKPANVMLDERDEPMLMDFGLARRDDDEVARTQDGAILGTPRYMSPEQARGDLSTLGPASDQYSLGVMLFELLSGQPLFSGGVQQVCSQHVEAEPPSLHSLDRTIALDLDAICLKCLEKRPEQRYSSALDLSDDLKRFLDGEPIKARKPKLLARATKWIGRHPTLCLAMAFLACQPLLAWIYQQFRLTLGLPEVGLVTVALGLSSVSLAATIRLVFLQPSRWKGFGWFLAILLYSVFYGILIQSLYRHRLQEVCVLILGSVYTGAWVGLVAGVLGTLVHWKCRGSHLGSIVGCVIGIISSVALSMLVQVPGLVLVLFGSPAVAIAVLPIVAILGAGVGAWIGGRSVARRS